jgi:hypothetical protein
VECATLDSCRFERGEPAVPYSSDLRFPRHMPYICYRNGPPPVEGCGWRVWLAGQKRTRSAEVPGRRAASCIGSVREVPGGYTGMAVSDRGRLADYHNRKKSAWRVSRESLILKTERCWSGRSGTLGNCSDDLRWRAADFDYRCRSRDLAARTSRWSITVNDGRSRRIDRVASQLRHSGPRRVKPCR